jgi:thymidylate synthase ThyX
MDDAWQALARDCATTAHRLDAVKPGLGDYARTNAHLLRAMFQANLRELYHFARLRADSHAQWEIRRLAADMDALVRAHAPLAARR